MSTEEAKRIKLGVHRRRMAFVAAKADPKAADVLNTIIFAADFLLEKRCYFKEFAKEMYTGLQGDVDHIRKEAPRALLLVAEFMRIIRQ